MEMSAGAEPLAELLATLDTHEAEWARLGSLHGPFGKYSDIRKAKLATIAMRLRSEVPPNGIPKWTDDLLDKAAHADKDYIAFVDESQVEHARYLELAAQRDGVDMKIHRGNALLRVAARWAA